MGDDNKPLEITENDPRHYTNWSTEQWVKFWEKLRESHKSFHAVLVTKVPYAVTSLIDFLDMNMGFEYDRLGEG